MSESASKRAPGWARAGYTISTDPALLDVAKIHRYLSEQSYWAQGITRELVERSIKNSLCFGVYSDVSAPPQLVGFARAVTDYATFAYMADVFILPGYQGQGLGKWLVVAMLEHPELQSLRRWTLRTEDAHDLYRRFGFDTEQEPQKYMSYRPQQSNSAPTDFERR